MEERIKISDIARHSGVSIATVSLVLNNRPGVSQDAGTRALEAAESLGYPIKSSPAIKRLRTVGVIVKTEPDLPPHANPFYSGIIAGIEDACLRDQITMTLAVLPVDSNNRPMQVPEIIHSNEVDGLLMVGAFVDETINSVLGKDSLPIVLVDAYTNAKLYDSIVSDNYQASYQAVEYLIQKGHRHIGLVGSESNAYPSLKQRRGGYTRALRDNEIPDTYIANFNIIHESTHDNTLKLLEKFPQITALFGINDYVALSAMRSAQESGRRVPMDLSIIGYDNIGSAAQAAPSLTTMQVDTITMGRAAILLLTNRLENPTSAWMTLTIHCSLIERESVASRP